MPQPVVFSRIASSIMGMLQPAEQRQARQLLQLMAEGRAQAPELAGLAKLKGPGQAYALPLGDSLLMVVELEGGQVTLKDVVNRELLSFYRSYWQPA
ncbi:MAG: hypothetical protein MUC97_11100 [Bernardetiaceae bacterium]|jgi:hypothetical protein|nr:hypothetical protein [Bernardetiaceae bacterium]